MLISPRLLSSFHRLSSPFSFASRARRPSQICNGGSRYRSGHWRGRAPPAHTRARSPPSGLCERARGLRARRRGRSVHRGELRQIVGLCDHGKRPDACSRLPVGRRREHVARRVQRRRARTGCRLLDPGPAAGDPGRRRRRGHERADRRRRRRRSERAVPSAIEARVHDDVPHAHRSAPELQSVLSMVPRRREGLAQVRLLGRPSARLTRPPLSTRSKFRARPLREEP